MKGEGAGITAPSFNLTENAPRAVRRNEWGLLPIVRLMADGYGMMDFSLLGVRASCVVLAVLMAVGPGSAPAGAGTQSEAAQGPTSSPYSGGLSIFRDPH